MRRTLPLRIVGLCVVLGMFVVLGSRSCRGYSCWSYLLP